MIARPNTDQAYRDVIEDLGLADLDDRTGTGDNAEHHDETVAS
ncbi:hypothetical protein [Mycolicibacterium sp. 624]